MLRPSLATTRLYRCTHAQRRRAQFHLRGIAIDRALNQTCPNEVEYYRLRTCPRTIYCTSTRGFDSVPAQIYPRFHCASSSIRTALTDSPVPKFLKFYF